MPSIYLIDELDNLVRFSSNNSNSLTSGIRIISPYCTAAYMNV